MTGRPRSLGGEDADTGAIDPVLKETKLQVTLMAFATTERWRWTSSRTTDHRAVQRWAGLLLMGMDGHDQSFILYKLFSVYLLIAWLERMGLYTYDGPHLYIS